MFADERAQLSLVPTDHEPAPAPKPPAAPAPPVDVAPPADLPMPDPILVSILSWKRPHGSKSEIEFCEWLHHEITRRGGVCIVGAEGCVIVNIPRADKKKPSTLFSCHVDTVHHEAKGRQSISYDPNFGHIFLDVAAPDAGSCLGADDAAGIWLMLEMISAKVPGTYVFHRGEERGGIGARAMLAGRREWLSEFEAAVAFDRPRTDEVITHQGRLRCASDKYGNALAARLNAFGFNYRTSDEGVFTDTKVYRGVIAECVNLGVGYDFQHSRSEYLDWGHLFTMRAAVVAIDWESLPIDRDPLAADPVPKQRWGGYGFDDDDDWRGRFPSWVDQSKRQPSPSPASQLPPAATPAPTPAEKVEVTEPDDDKFSTTEPTSSEELAGWSLEDLRGLCSELGDDAAVVIADLLAEVDALKAKVKLYRAFMQ